MNKKVISLLLATVISTSQLVSTSMALTSENSSTNTVATAANNSRAALGMSMSAFSEKLPSMGFDESGWFGYDGAIRVKDGVAYFVLMGQSDEFCKAIKESFNLLLPTEGNELYNIVSNAFENRTYEMDGRTVKINQHYSEVYVEIHDNYKAETEESVTGGSLKVGMSFSNFKKELSGLGIKDDKYVENGKTMGTITATSTSAKFIIENKSTKFNAVIKKAFGMLFPKYSEFYYNEVMNGTYESVTYSLDNREVKITRSGSKTTVYVSRLDLSNISPREVSNYIYTGKSIEPKLTFEHRFEIDGEIGVYFLSKDKDYTVEFKNNKYPGTATITIKGIGNFKGSQTITFKIFPKKTTSVKYEDRTSSSIQLSWTKQSYVSGYEILRSTSKLGTYTRVGRVTSNTATYKDTGLSSGKTYYYKVRSYKLIDGKRHYGSSSTIYSVSTRCKTPVITLSSTKSKNAKVSWDAVTNASGYEVYRATSEKGTYKKIKTITSGKTTSYTSTNLTSGNKYYYKVRAYKTVSGNKVYSYYSKIKSIKVK